MHLIHTVLKLLQRFLLLVRKRAVQFFSIPGDQLQQFLQPFIATSALLEGGYVTVPELLADVLP